MQRVWAFLVAPCAALLSGSLDARADPLPARDVPRPAAAVTEPTDPGAAWKQRQLSLEAHLGMATPVSVVGVTLEYSPYPVIGFGGGIGTNFFVGPAVAALVRVRPVYGVRDALVVSGAFSAAPYGFRPISLDGSSTSDTTYWHADFLPWVQGDVGWEHRARKGLVLRIALGLAFVTNPGALHCRGGDGTCTEDKPSRLTTFEFGIGYAFPSTKRP